METKAQSVPNTTTKKHTKKLPVVLKGSAKAKKLPPRLGGV